MFGRDWEPATARIVMARVSGVGGQTGLKSIFEFQADVTALDSGETFRAKLDDPHERGFRPPGEGMEIRVLADSKHHKAKFDMSDRARTNPKNLLAGPDHVPTDDELLAAWQANQDHAERASEIMARADRSQLAAWTATSNDLSMALMHLTNARPDWKSPYQRSRE
jgi:hypothetical protein